jgi:hypothetical protein
MTREDLQRSAPGYPPPRAPTCVRGARRARPWITLVHAFDDERDHSQ